MTPTTREVALSEVSDELESCKTFSNNFKKRKRAVHPVDDIMAIFQTGVKDEEKSFVPIG